MTHSILDRVIKCREEINGIKTSQATQADSYIFYKYSTSNLYSLRGRTVEVVFQPLKADKEQVICNFYLADLRTNSQFEFSISLNDTLRATLAIPSQSAEESWQQQIYITCISNVEGFLQTIIY